MTIEECVKNLKCRALLHQNKALEIKKNTRDMECTLCFLSLLYMVTSIVEFFRGNGQIEYILWLLGTWMFLLVFLVRWMMKRLVEYYLQNRNELLSFVDEFTKDLK